MALGKRQDDSPGGLAAELDSHFQKFQAARASVIERAHTRQKQIAAMIKELEVEHLDHKKVLDKAAEVGPAKSGPVGPDSVPLTGTTKV